MEQLNFKIEVFEGPLELLLHLISKHKLNINDIPIAELLEQYLAYIEDMKLADLEVTGDFLAMAAHLVYIKTVSLLPKHEEADTLKKELEGQLLEYQLCKQIAEDMAKRFCGYDVFIRQRQNLTIDKTYSLSHSPDELLGAYITAIGKGKRNLPPPQTAFSGIVTRRMVSVTGRIIFVLKKLYKSGEVSYDEFFASGDRSELVATFLAMLELVKSSRITVSDDNKTVYLSRERKPKAKKNTGE